MFYPDVSHMSGVIPLKVADLTNYGCQHSTSCCCPKTKSAALKHFDLSGLLCSCIIPNYDLNYDPDLFEGFSLFFTILPISGK